MVPEKLKYTKEHEWVKKQESEIIIGITDYAQSELGDIVFVELPNVGDKFNQNDTLGTIEAVKTVADIFSPVSGSIVEVNNEIEDNPEYVNSDPYNKGWLVKIRIEDESCLENLLSSQEYSEMIS
tara:strand:+ start:94 stop:468 length:375 start_codon:yes stop_codon:yes gene_type:complete